MFIDFNRIEFLGTQWNLGDFQKDFQKFNGEVENVPVQLTHWQTSCEMVVYFNEQDETYLIYNGKLERTLLVLQGDIAKDFPHTAQTHPEIYALLEKFKEWCANYEFDEPFAF